MLIRHTLQGLKVLRCLASENAALSGADIGRLTGIGPGTLYPILARFSLNGWTTSRWERVNPSVVGRPRRQLHRLTKRGRRVIRANEELWSPLKNLNVTLYPL